MCEVTTRGCGEGREPQEVVIAAFKSMISYLEEN